MTWRTLFSKKNDIEAKELSASVNKRTLTDAYKRRREDLDSLKQYDRGEKTIHAPDLGTTV